MRDPPPSQLYKTLQANFGEKNNKTCLKLIKCKPNGPYWNYINTEVSYNA